MNKRNRMISILLCVTLLAGIMIEDAGTAKAAAQITATGEDIVYPVSLVTGKDAGGHTVFPDRKFLQYIKQETFRSGENRGLSFDLDGDGRLSREECDLVQVIEINGRSDVRSVEGIEAFPGLRELRCGYTGITKIDLAGNRLLQELSVYGNDIRELDVSMCPLLRYLNISSSSLTSLDLGRNQALEELNMGIQTRAAGEYIEDNRYLVNLKDLDAGMELAKISDVRIDGAPGDGIHSGYEAEKGIVYCSDEICQVSYVYDTGSVTGKRMEVTLNTDIGWRQGYDSRGGSFVTAQYVPERQTDTEPETPYRAGYRFTGWYSDPTCTEKSRWSFGQRITQNMTLYAGWMKRQYRVLYDPAGGKMSLREKQGGVDWWTTNLIPSGKNVPVRNGYRLEGWKTEKGTFITTVDAAKISYGQIVRRDGAESSVLKAGWRAKEGYKLRFASWAAGTKKKPEDMPEDLGDGDLAWDSTEIVAEEDDPVLPGYEFCGWYTAKSGGRRITEASCYGDIYAAQFSGDSAGKVPVLYARFKKKAYTIHYNVGGGTKVKDRKNIIWGAKNLLPARKKIKRKNYIFAGWRSVQTNKRITKKTKLDTGVCDGTSSTVTLKAVWYKKYEKKGKTFRRYGIRYKVTQSGKKGNKVKVTGIAKKKVSIPKRVFYNGIRFKVTGIKKSVLKKYKRVTKGGRTWKRK